MVGTENPVAIKVIAKARLDNRPKLLMSTIQEMSIMMSIEKHVSLFTTSKKIKNVPLNILV